MKIIHTFFPTKYCNLSSEILMNMALSCLLVKNLGYEIILYTTEDIKNLVTKISLPYDYVDSTILDKKNDVTFSIPKLRVYAEQKSEYIHIDLDTFLFEHTSVTNKEITYCTFFEGLGVIKGFSGDILYSAFDGFHRTYYSKSNELIPKLDKKFVSNIRFDYIPNMSFIGGYQYELLSDASKICLSIYEKNYMFFDEDYYNACIIEQLFIPAAMRCLNEKTKFEALFNGNPNIFFVKDENTKYPFEIVSNGEKISVSSLEDLESNIDYNFNGFLHLNGYKNFEPIVYLLKRKIKKFKNGEEIVSNIEKVYE